MNVQSAQQIGLLIMILTYVNAHRATSSIRFAKFVIRAVEHAQQQHLIAHLA